MKFSHYDMTGDVTINLMDDGIHIAYKDLKSKEAKCLTKIIKEAGLDIIQKGSNKEGEILLTGKDTKTAMAKFIEVNRKQLKKGEFFLLITKDDKAKIIPWSKELPKKVSVDELKEILKIPKLRDHDCGEDTEKVDEFLKEMEEHDD